MCNNNKNVFGNYILNGINELLIFYIIPKGFSTFVIKPTEPVINEWNWYLLTI